MAIEAPAAIEQPMIAVDTIINDVGIANASFVVRDDPPSVAHNSNLEVGQEAAPEPADAREAATSSVKFATDSEAQPMDVELLESKPSSEPHAAPAPSAKPPANGTNGAPVSAPQANGNIPVDSDSEDDVPLSKRIVTPAAKPRPGGVQKRPLQNGDSKPGAAKKLKPVVPAVRKEAKPEAAKAPAKKAVNKEAPVKKKNKAPAGEARGGTDRSRAAPSRPPVSRVAKEDQSSSQDRIVKWDTLVHAGVLFPPEYEVHGVQPLYEGNPVTLNAEQEELVTMIAMMKDTEYMQKPTFLKNTWAALKDVLGKGHAIKCLEKCDFSPIFEWHLMKKEAIKALTKEEKLDIKASRTKAEEKYTIAMVDGRPEQLGNFRVEPPGLFRGRGEHPKMGKFKKRIFPRDITINIGKGVPIPEHPYPGQKWKEVRHDNTVTWLAYWKDPVNEASYKYVWLAANSTFKCESDLAKYEKARKLKDYIGPIRAAYEKDWSSKSVKSQQIAVALYFIDVLALRAGHEKEEDEADTVGCCTLKAENVECIEPCQIKFDFLGKDSVRYVNTVEVHPKVFANVQCWIGRDVKNGRKEPGDQLFDGFDATDLNKRLKELMDGLSAKVFRTFNASITLDRLLWEEEEDEAEASLDHKKALYDRANKEVAILCNHQKAVGKGHDGAMEKLEEKLKELRKQLKDLKSSKAIDAKVAAKVAQISKMELSARVKEDLKTVALGTSKINYLDPRITVAWCKRNEVPMEKIFNKSLLSKFAWSMDCDPQFKF